MVLVPVKTPKVVKSLFPNYVWNIDTSEKIIYLTFDDGPTPEITEWTLDILKRYNAKATFFCIGANVEKYPSIFQQVLNDGHAIGNHTQHHIKGWKTKAKEYLKNIELCEAVLKSQITNSDVKAPITKAIGTLTVNLFRPPYGKITSSQGKSLIELGYKIIMWDVLPFDWKENVSPDECLNNVISKTKEGSIIVFHDSVKASRNMQYALPKVLECFSEKGYRFEVLDTIN
ncbi:polysaccharide deacetylase family protein [Algibacter sp. 2305UL17-15]|uniref:polysaccharide deacetylase family protein n=1 Tax=Algibacter sp. 2305UL17-15 TaxID=3231268 RepID=UPI003458A385